MVKSSKNMQPLILVYSETNSHNISGRMGLPEYSYYFVLKWFVPVLERLGQVRVILDPLTEADTAFDAAQAEGRACVLFSFAPPHRTLSPQRCPLVPLVAWEFERIPDYTWDGNPENDWRFNLGKSTLTITHSEFARQAIKRAMPPEYPVWSIPAPVWDRFSSRGQKLHGSAGRTPARGMDLTIDGAVFDSAQHIPRSLEAFLSAQTTHLDPVTVKKLRRTARRRRSARKLMARMMGKTIEQYDYDKRKKAHHLHSDGVVYASILNPSDARKNWGEIVTAFVSCFQDVDDAVLLLKFNENSSIRSFNHLEHELRRFTWMKCRVIAFNGYLPDNEYDRFLDSIDFVVNASTGEGQCLPLMELMSMGVPAIAPDHTSMADYITKDNAFILPSARHITCWPHDPRFAYSTYAYSTSWEALKQAFAQSYDVAKNRPDIYGDMSLAAVQRLREHCSEHVVTKALTEVLNAVGAKVQDALPAGAMASVTAIGGPNRSMPPSASTRCG